MLGRVFDGSRTEDRLSTVSSSGAGFSTGLSCRFWAGCTWGHVDGDGSFVRDEVSGVGVGGCGVYSSRSGAGWFHRRWGHLELLPPGDPGVEHCILFDSVPGPLQSVQRAELWVVILALQVSRGVHLGVDNLNVVRHVGRMLAAFSGSS